VTTLRLVCLGNLTVDDIVLPGGLERQGCAGGDALYAALAARLFEPAVEMVAPIGTDLPRTTLHRIAAAGLSLDGLKPRPLPTLHNRVVYGAAGDRTWTTYFSEADFDALSPEADDIPPGFRDAEGFLVLAMTLTGQERLVAWARRETKALIALDPQEDYILGHQERLMALIGQTDVFMPSAEEVQRLLGHEDWEAAARLFAGRGPNLVVIKLGQDGTVAYSRDRDHVVRCPALNIPAVDTTGAGDSFCGAMIAHLLQAADDLDGALRAGTVAASFAIGGYGAEPLFSADPEQVRASLRRLTPTR
jgi:ribokinase